MSATRIDQSVLDQAYAWVVALRRENVEEKNFEDFSDWLMADECHQTAWEQALDFWQTLGATSQLPVDELLIKTSQQQTMAIDEQPSLVQRWGGLWRPVALAFSLAVIGFIALFNFQPHGHAYKAETGQYLAVTLDDGSVVELNTNTEVEVLFSDSARNVNLLRGEAFFTVASDSQRPFTVSVGGGKVRAVGTAFNIYRSSEQIAIVSVTEGIVRVEEAGGTSVSTARSQLLTIDEAIVIDRVRGLSRSDVHNEQVTAWRRGQLLFDNTTISEAVEMLNRYLRKKVILADDVSKNTRISGTFSSRQKRETLTGVAQALGLELTDEENHWLLSQPNP